MMSDTWPSHGEKISSNHNRSVWLSFESMEIPHFCGGMILFKMQWTGLGIAEPRDFDSIQQQFIGWLKDEGCSSFYAYDVEGQGWDKFFAQLPESFEDEREAEDDYYYNAVWTKFRSERFTNMNSGNEVVQVGYKVGAIEADYRDYDGDDDDPW